MQNFEHGKTTNVPNMLGNSGSSTDCSIMAVAPWSSEMVIQFSIMLDIFVSVHCVWNFAPRWPTIWSVLKFQTSTITGQCTRHGYWSATPMICRAVNMLGSMYPKSTTPAVMCRSTHSHFQAARQTAGNSFLFFFSSMLNIPDTFQNLILGADFSFD